MPEETHDSVLAEMRQRPDLFDYETISEVLELDDEGSHDFTNSLFGEGCEVGERALKELNEAHEKEDMIRIGDNSRFLKGTFATMGAKRARDIMGKLGNLASFRHEDGHDFVERSDALKRVGEILQSGDKDFKDTLSYYRRLSKSR